jgi:hypothetical protein
VKKNMVVKVKFSGKGYSWTQKFRSYEDASRYEHKLNDIRKKNKSGIVKSRIVKSKPRNSGFQLMSLSGRRI